MGLLRLPPRRNPRNDSASKTDTKQSLYVNHHCPDMYGHCDPAKREKQSVTVMYRCASVPLTHYSPLTDHNSYLPAFFKKRFKKRNSLV